jgi:thiamine biosynthesis lipoprotein ApbE
VSVITKNSTTASSLAAAFCVLGQDGINKFIAKYHSTMRIFVVTDEKGAKKIYIFK